MAKQENTTRRKKSKKEKPQGALVLNPSSTALPESSENPRTGTCFVTLLMALFHSCDHSDQQLHFQSFSVAKE
jgi:hypothetical protein